MAAKVSKRILIIKPSSLGDIVHALPALAEIRKKNPTAFISWMVKKEWAPMLRGHPMLDEVLEVNFTVSSLFSVVRVLRDRCFDLVFDLQGLLRTGLLSWVSGAPIRIGFADAREGAYLFYTRSIIAPMREMHAVDRYLLLASYLGETIPEVNFVLPDSEEVRTKVKNLFDGVGLDSSARVIGIAPSARWITKRWESSSFAEVADQLQDTENCKVVFIGGPNENEKVCAVKNLMKTTSANLTGLTAVSDLPAVMQRLSVLITNDSGPMHIAAAVGTPVVALFGPTSELCTGPYGSLHSVLTSYVECRPCFRRKCHNSKTHECLTSISVKDVMVATKRILHGEGLT